MNQHNVHLLDLPNEILFMILKKLENIDVLYSLLGTNNQRLEIIEQEQIFTNILNFISISQSTDEISSISGSILDQFCIDILPRIHKNVKSLIVESVSMECILDAGIYPNLTELKIFNFNKAIVSRYFIDDSLFGHIFKQQITDLVLHLSIVSASINDYPPLSLYISPPLTFSSSTLTKLCINVHAFDDCLSLLDGRFKQLTTFIVQDDLSTLKCFSLICYDSTEGYNNLILPLLRRMSYLEELTLYLHILGGSTFISGTHLDNEILSQMPRLRTFSFYFASENAIVDPAIHISNSDIERTFTNIKHRQMACLIDDYSCMKLVCRVFSLPFKFDRLENITNNIPNIVFNSVSHLKLRDKYPFKHEFFIRVARGFPFLKSLSIDTVLAPNWRSHEYHRYHIDWCSIIEYPHLISLDVYSANSYYAEHFLNETKTHLPRLTELKIRYEDLEMVTKNFTRNETRCNCAKVKRLIVKHRIGYSKDVYHYFPLL
ncbi:unnamed protein product [Rotaria sordida]|uniref:F-box domain-containing protein n=1 Tax=Rotaria sordida TaxID=392033 RepID=A0A815R7H2_9BILA|nr:unnamed protein product [Rotaria sordida]